VIDSFFRLLSSRAFWIAVACTLILVFAYLFGYRWRPSIAVQFKQRAFLESLEDNSEDELADLVSADYSDSWGLKKPKLTQAFKDLRRHFLFLNFEASDIKVALDGDEARVSAIVKLSGRGSPIAEIIMDRANRVEAPFVFVWRKEGGAPWKWRLVSVTNADLPDLQGYRPGDGGLMDEF
jgi:hypothetical protein